jgi:hypothetical protein
VASPATTQHLVSPHALSHFSPVDRGKTGQVSANTTNLATPANYVDIAAIDARLTAISATSYSAARLIQMTLNDKLYALARNDNPNLRA